MNNMKIVFYSSQVYDKESIIRSAENKCPEYELTFYKYQLNKDTAKFANGFDAVVIFVNDIADHIVLQMLATYGIKLILLRCAGYDMIDLITAKKLGITILRVPAYSPYSVAEHAMALILSLNRKINIAFNRTREFNFNLSGLLGFDMNGKTIGIIGTGKIGTIFAKICNGFGCNVIAYDVKENKEAIENGVKYVNQDELFRFSDIISLHCPLLPTTHHIINKNTIEKMKTGVMIINTSRGGLVDTASIIEGLKSKKIGSIALDVYEGEKDIFNRDLSDDIIVDDKFARLFTFPNVIVTGHQAYFTKEALENIADITMDNAIAYFKNEKLLNQV